MIKVLPIDTLFDCLHFHSKKGFFLFLQKIILDHFSNENVWKLAQCKFWLKLTACNSAFPRNFHAWQKNALSFLTGAWELKEVLLKKNYSVKLDLLKGPIHFLLLKLTCYKRRWSTLEVYFCNQYQIFIRRKKWTLQIGI